MKMTLYRGGGELRYMVTDLGASFGRVKADAPVLWHFMRDRNDPRAYADDPFVEDVRGDRVNLFYRGKREDQFDDISVRDARWLANLLTKLSDKQIGDAFAAANYSPEEVRLLTGAVRSRIKELAGVV